MNAPKATQLTADMSVGSVTSQDGTAIGYLRLGQGPAVVLLHGSMESASSHTRLALALADAFTVYLSDRRGRGMTGPYPSGYGIRTEVEDLQAILAESGAEMVFGVSAGGLVALEAARRLPAIRKVAVYEPALLMDASRHTGWISRFDQEMAQGKVAAAMVTSMYGLELAPPIFKVMPRRLLESLTRLAMKSEDKKATSGTITMRKLAPTVRYRGSPARRAGRHHRHLRRDVRRRTHSSAAAKACPSFSRPSTPLPAPSRTTSAWSSPASITAAQATPAAPTPAAASQNSSPRRCAASSPSRDPPAPRD